MSRLSFKQRAVRVFLSSTFRDFGEERDLLVRKVFPTLRARLAERFVDLVDVDLRWGITEAEAEQGEVLPICLAEIDRARPFFIGLLGERYGWIPPTETYPPAVLEQHPWLEEHRGGKSVTELEILHGVLNNPAMAGRAMFYFRSPDYAKTKGGDYVALSTEDQAKQDALKDRVRGSAFPVVENYATPEDVAERIQEDLWSALEVEFPATEVPDAFTRDLLQHEAYAAPRRRIYLGGETYLQALDQALKDNTQWILLNGESGSGKSALLANWIEGLTDEDLITHVHYVGANPSAADPVAMVRRIIEWIRKETQKSLGLTIRDRQLLQTGGIPSSHNSGGFYFDAEFFVAQRSKWKYPYHFIDFESSTFALPLSEGMSPYETVALQFSHHVMQHNEKVEHRSQLFVSSPGYSGNFDFVRELKKSLDGDRGTIFRWSAHENVLLNQIKNQLATSTQAPSDKDELIQFIESITNDGSRTMEDLNSLCVVCYFHPATQGSTSIKKVLPAVFSTSRLLEERYSKPIGSRSASLNFPENFIWFEKTQNRVTDPYALLSRFEKNKLKDLNSGSSAEYLLREEFLIDNSHQAHRTLVLEELTSNERQRIKDSLLRKCELDTLAMVMIMQAWIEWS